MQCGNTLPLLELPSTKATGNIFQHVSYACRTERRNLPETDDNSRPTLILTLHKTA